MENGSAREWKMTEHACSHFSAVVLVVVTVVPWSGEMRRRWGTCTFERHRLQVFLEKQGMYQEDHIPENYGIGSVTDMVMGGFSDQDE